MTTTSTTTRRQAKFSASSMPALLPATTLPAAPTAKAAKSAAKSKRAPKPYTPSALFRVYDKATGACLGYLAPSRDGSTHYEVTCDDRGGWHCTCPATVEDCCHVTAAQALCKDRVERGQPGCWQGRAKELEQAEPVAEVDVVEEPAREIVEVFAASAPAEESASIVEAPRPAMPAPRKPAPAKRTDELRGNLNGAATYPAWLSVLPSRQERRVS